MGITNFARYGDDTKPEYRCSFSVLQEYACVGDKNLAHSSQQPHLLTVYGQANIQK